MQRNRFKQVATLEDRLIDRVRQAREDVEKLPPGEGRDSLIDKIRKIEAAIEIDRFLKSGQRA